MVSGFPVEIISCGLPDTTTDLSNMTVTGITPVLKVPDRIGEITFVTTAGVCETCGCGAGAGWVWGSGVGVGTGLASFVEVVVLAGGVVASVGVAALGILSVNITTALFNGETPFVGVAACSNGVASAGGTTISAVGVAAPPVVTVISVGRISVPDNDPKPFK